MFSRLLAMGALCALFTVTAQAAPGFDLFAMDNGVGRGTWSPEQQAAALHELGYQGISYNYTGAADLATCLKALRPRKLELYGVYFPARLEGEPGLPPDLGQAVRLLEGSRAALWLTIPASSQPGDHEAQAVRRIREAANLAATAGLRVVLYPHKGFYMATAEHAFALTLKAARTNVGVTVNLAHELAAGNGARLPDVIRQVAPCLSLVTLNGATDRPASGWDNYIKLLGDGDYDVQAILRTLHEVRYRGPVGLQFYNVKGDVRANLQSAMRAWQSLDPGAKVTSAP